jgi:hypothetical protein
MHARFCSPMTGRFTSVDPVLQIRRAQRHPQHWNRYAYAAGNPLKYRDPSGKVLEITGCSGTQKKECEAQALNQLRNTVPPELRMFVRLTTKGGKTIVDARYLNVKRNALSGNFYALRQVANSPGLVQLNTTASSFTTRSGESETLSGAIGSFGVTLDPHSQSPQSGVTMVFVASDLGAQDTAETLAHELRHANLILRGLAFSHELTMSETSPGNYEVTFDPNGPVNMVTDAAEREARENYDPFIPPQ